MSLRVSFFCCCFPHLFTICLHILFSIDICQMVTFYPFAFSTEQFSSFNQFWTACFECIVQFFFFFSLWSFISLYAEANTYVCSVQAFFYPLRRVLHALALALSFRLTCLFNIRFALLIAMYCTNTSICQNGYNIRM